MECVDAEMEGTELCEMKPASVMLTASEAEGVKAWNTDKNLVHVVKEYPNGARYEG